MKLLVFFIPFLASQYNSEPINPNVAKTSYYFCVSGAMYSSTVKGIQVIFYTDISTITGEENEIKLQAAKWRSLVDRGCENPHGCSSDLNYYETEEAAKIQLEHMKEHFRDEKKYVLKKLSLE